MKDMSEKKQVRTMQVLVVFFIVLSVVIAMDPPTFIATADGISWGALAGAFLAPFMYGLVLERQDKSRCMGQLASVSDYGSESVLPLYCISPINAGAVAMVAGLIVVPVERFTPKLC